MSLYEYRKHETPAYVSLAGISLYESIKPLRAKCSKTLEVSRPAQILSSDFVLLVFMIMTHEAQIRQQHRTMMELCLEHTVACGCSSGPETN